MAGSANKIVLIGPESSGKTTLCQELAVHFKAICIPEFAREYMEKLNRKYTYEDVEFCVREQFRLEEQAMKKATSFIFCDTDALMAKVWFEDVFRSCPDWVSDYQEKHPADLYLLLQPDLPFIDDPVRENPMRRDYFYQWYKEELIKAQLPFTETGGKGKLRFENALNAILQKFDHTSETHNGQ